jgi:hypothetical protein
MKKSLLIFSLMLLVFASMTFASDIAKSKQYQDDLKYIMAKKASGKLDLNDPAYLRVLQAAHNDYAPPRGASVDQGNDGCPATHIAALPFTDTGNTCNMVNDFGPECYYGSYYPPDVIYEFTAPTTGIYIISLCGSYYDTELEVRSGGTCPGTVSEGCNDDNCGLQSQLSLNLTAGTQYFVIVEGYSSNCGDYVLNISTQVYGRCCYGDPTNPYCYETTESECENYYAGNWTEGLTCNDPCPVTLPCDHIDDGLVQNPDGSYTFRQTTDATSVPPLYYGPFSHPNSTCDTQSGFGIYSWFDGDYGWAHYWANWNQGYTIQSVQVAICAWDVDQYTCLQNYPYTDCETDSLFADGVPTNPTYLFGDNIIWSLTTVDVAPGALLDDGYVNMFMNIDVWHTTCNWATTLSWSQLIVTYTVGGTNNPPYNPTGVGMDCVDILNPMCVTITGPTPPDPDGDAVTYTYRWFVANASTGWAYQDDELNPMHPVNHTGNCVPASDFDVADYWRVQVYAVDSHGAQSLYPLIVDFPQIVTSCCQHVNPGDWCADPILPSGSFWTGNFDLCDYCNDYDLSPCTGYASDAADMVFKVHFTGPNNNLYVGVDPTGNWDIALAVTRVCGDFSATSCLDGEDENGPGILEYAWLGNLSAGDYFITVSGYGTDCGPFFIAICSNHELPVELVSFTGTAGDQEARLNWVTGSESDNSHFYLIRSTDNRNYIRISNDIVGTNSPSGGSYFYLDRNLVNGTTYYYKLVDVDINGVPNINGNVVEVMPNSTSNMIPSAYSLHQNYPNPFNPNTSIAYDLSEAGHVTLTVFDVLGREVMTLVNENQTAGSYSVEFNASTLSSGIYFYQLKVNDFTDMKKMVVMK